MAIAVPPSTEEQNEQVIALPIRVFELDDSFDSSLERVFSRR